MTPAMKPDDIPEDVMSAAEDAYQAAIYMTTHDEPQAMVAMVARAIMAERERTEARMLDLLKAPAAVRVNYLRGNIACQPLIDEAVVAERDRCAKIAEGFEQTRDWVPGSLYDTLRREVAAAIRQER